MAFDMLHRDFPHPLTLHSNHTGMTQQQLLRQIYCSSTHVYHVYKSNLDDTGR
uniref:Uncharacterized protein n=1 Tax=Anguilla anguilla TaxID=7936 RepID=A0A0E9USZ7_ANGAN